jgi:uncharacterized protein YceK
VLYHFIINMLEKWKGSNIMRKEVKAITALAIASGLMLSGCGSGTTTSKNSSKKETASTTKVETKLNKIDNSKWQYNSDDNVYWQVGISYCESPVNKDYETAGIFVPGDFMTAKDNGDGTYTCKINSNKKVGNYTAKTAPVVISVNTPGYMAMAAPTAYDSSVSSYTKAGFVYYNPGCRGRDDGAPSGVTDLKAAVRYFRYNDGNVPGDSDRIFTFGHSGGGAQSSLMGSTGDSDLYTPYLKKIGAVSGISDAICGAMCWCPITNLDSADSAYEWNMGNTRSGLSSDEQAISNALAEKYADYINNSGLKDSEGNKLTLEKSSDGIYQAGTYYDYIKSVIQTSLENFLKDTTFPYDASAASGSQMGGMAGGMGKMSGGLPSGGLPSGGLPSGGLPDKTGNASSGTGDASTSGTSNDNISRTQTTGSLSLSGTYQTAKDYIDALNANGNWVSYDESTGKVTITSVAAFTSALKPASKGIGAFDQLDASQGENTLFGYGDGKGAHFDSMLYSILKDQGSQYADSYKTDLAKKDAIGYTEEKRVNMYTPLYYLLKANGGYKKSTVAKYWRIRTGINQSDTALSTEVNLALALQQYGVDSVDFATVWGLGHTQAERTGTSTDNFIEWVNTCLK